MLYVTQKIVTFSRLHKVSLRLTAIAVDLPNSECILAKRFMPCCLVNKNNIFVMYHETFFYSALVWIQQYEISKISSQGKHIITLAKFTPCCDLQSVSQC